MELNKVICGDSLEYMKTLPDKCIDLVLTDPPYGLGDKTTKGGCSKNSQVKFEQHNWDNNIPDDEYFKEMFRISKNQLIWGGNYFPYLWKTGCRGLITWDKMVYIPTMSQIEYCWYSEDKLPKLIKINNTDFNRQHPTQKPKELFKWCLENYSKPGDIILDCFAGSGTTAIACIETGRNYIVIEKEPKYVEIIEKRIKNTTPPLFVI